MIYVADKFTLEGEQVAVVTKIYPETLITNTGDSIAVIHLLSEMVVYV